MKKRIISILLAAVIGVSMLTACGSETKETISGAEGSSEAGAENSADEKVLRIAFPDTLTTVDVANVTSATMLKEVAGVCETLVHADEDFTLQPNLATEWKMTGDNTWEFKLREDVLFHDGTRMDAEAVKWSIEWELENNSAFAGSTYIESVEALDDFTVQFTTSQKTTDLPAALSYVGTVIVSPSSVNSDGEFVTAVGTGYYKQAVFDEMSGTFECVVFEDYWQPVETNVTRRVVRSITDASARSLAVQRNRYCVGCAVQRFGDPCQLGKCSGFQI